MNRLRKPAHLSYESLEERKLLAGDVSVVEDGNLYIRGDELSNQIAIIADESGQVTISGLNNTTINGSTESFRVSNSVDLNGARGRNASFEGGLRILTYGGNDRIDIQGIELGDSSLINTGEGDDFVRFIRSTSHHDFVANSGSGDDTLNFVQTRVRGAFGVSTDNGEDSIRLHNSRTWGDTTFQAGAGDDSLTINRVRFSGDLQRVMAQAGDDQIEIRNNDVNESGLAVLAGHGRDEVFAEMNLSNELDGEIVIAGQDGFDVIEMDVVDAMLENIQQNGFEQSGNLVYDDGTSGVEGVTNISGSYFELDSTHIRYASNIIPLETTETISRISWSGGYLRDINDDFADAYETDDFTIEIYEGVASSPTGDPIASFDVGNDVNRVDTGIVLPLGGIYQAELFSYSAEIDVTLEAGKIYWVSIYAGVEDEVPAGAFAGNYSVWGWGGGPGENPGANATAYAGGTGPLSSPRWYNDFGGGPFGSADFQLWS